MTENDNYDFAAPIKIYDEKPLLISQSNGRVNFKSDDGLDYDVRVDPDTITDTKFPLKVLGDDKTYGFTIKSDAEKGEYRLFIDKAKSDVKQTEEPDVMELRQNPPRMVIKVE